MDRGCHALQADYEDEGLQRLPTTSAPVPQLIAITVSDFSLS